jgi:VWFA-related protein
MIRPASSVSAAVLSFLGGFVIIGASPQNQSQNLPRFRGGVELVTLDVSVLDRDRHPVRELTAADFVVFEDGKPQKVNSFSAVDLPDLDADPEMSAAWLREAAPDVVKNTDFKDRQTVTIVMDDATPMKAADVAPARQVARQIIERLAPGDVAGVVFVFDKKSGQEFTQDRRRLLAAVDRFNGAIPNPFGSFDEFDGMALTLYHAVLGTLNGIARAMGELTDRRKAVFFVSVGIPLDWNVAQGQPVSMTNPGQASESGAFKNITLAMEQMFDAARRTNVNVYAFDPGGLRAPSFDAPLGGIPVLNLNPGRPNQEFLETLADATGGLAVVRTNDPVPGITQALRENRSYYLLGYMPANRRTEGRFRKIEVKVNRPGVTVRTRSGYFEPRAAEEAKAARTAPPRAVDTSLSAVVPKFDELPLHLTAAPFAIPGKRQAGVALVLGVRHPTPSRVTRVVESVQVRADVYTPDGIRRASRREKIPVTVNTVGMGTPVGYELLLRLDLLPGRYYVRVSAEASLQGIQLSPSAPRVALIKPGEDVATRSGSVYCDLDVPDFTGDALSASGLALAVTPAVVSGPKGRFASLLPVVPTTLRDFTRDDQVSAFMRVHQGTGQAAQPVTVDLTIRDWRDVIVAHRSEVLAVERFNRGGADYPFDVPLGNLAPGPHLLRVEATLGSRVVRRDVRFTMH